jgi:hypothetical protein
LEGDNEQNAISDNDKSCGKGSCGRLLDLFDLIIGLWLLVESLLLGIFGQPFQLIGLLAAVLFFILACIFIYEGAREVTTPLVPTVGDEAKPQGPRTQSVKVTYAPTTELVVHEVIEQDQTTFFQDIMTQVSASPVHVEPSVNWVDGFALLSTQFPPTNEVIADNLAGKIHYQTVIFTRILFHSKVNMKLRDHEYSVILRKADNDLTLAALVSFLKEFKPRILGHASDLSAQNFQQ